MTTPEALRSLADRVEAGESGREIDREISGALRLVWTTDRGWMVSATVPLDWYPKHGGWTTSLDATEALREGMLPGWRLSLAEYPDKMTARLLRPDFGGSVVGQAIGELGDRTREPRARLAATLRAYAVQIEETSDAG